MFSRPLRLLFPIFVLVAAACVARAELFWIQRAVVLTPPAGAAEATTHFECMNVGTKAVKLAEVRSSCGCTAAALEKTVLKPGEKTRIAATFHVGERRGRQSVDVNVLTDDPAHPAYTLTLHVDIKDFAVLTPRSLYWNVGDSGDAKLMQVSLLSGFRLVEARSANDAFEVEIVSQNEKSAQLRVKPRDTWAKRAGTIEVKVAQGGQSATSLSAVVRVL